MCCEIRNDDETPYIWCSFLRLIDIDSVIPKLPGFWSNGQIRILPLLPNEIKPESNALSSVGNIVHNAAQHARLRNGGEAAMQ